MEILNGELVANELNKNSNGGTELIARRMQASLPADLLKEFHIVHSRVRAPLDESKIRVLICHDLPEKENEHLKNGGWRKWHRIVFVSHWQREWFIRAYDIPWSKTVVIHNAIAPLEPLEDKGKDRIRIIYHTTPHRGLDILVPVVGKLSETHPEIHLDVFSSFEIYGWEDRPQDKQLFEAINNHPNMTHHGYQPQDVVRAAVEKAHIFAYPSIWQETSCMALMEAMSGGCICVHSDLAALPETAANWTHMYSFHEDRMYHAARLHGLLDVTIEIAKDPDSGQLIKLQGQKSYVDLFYNWDFRVKQWEAFLHSLLNEPREFEKEKKMFNYQVI